MKCGPPIGGPHFAFGRGRTDTMLKPSVRPGEREERLKPRPQ